MGSSNKPGVIMDAETLRAKAVIVGSRGVGKSSLLAAATGAPFDPARPSTVGVDIQYVHTAGAKLEVWDTAGEKQFLALTPNFFRGAALVFMCYDTTRPCTLDDLINDWLPRLDKDVVWASTVVVVVGLRCVDTKSGLTTAVFAQRLWEALACRGIKERVTVGVSVVPRRVGVSSVFWNGVKALKRHGLLTRGGDALRLDAGMTPTRLTSRKADVSSPSVSKRDDDHDGERCCVIC